MNYLMIRIRETFLDQETQRSTLHGFFPRCIWKNSLSVCSVDCVSRRRRSRYPFIGMMTDSRRLLSPFWLSSMSAAQRTCKEISRSLIPRPRKKKKELIPLIFSHLELAFWRQVSLKQTCSKMCKNFHKTTLHERTCVTYFWRVFNSMRDAILPNRPLCIIQKTADINNASTNPFFELNVCKEAVKILQRMPKLIPSQ